MTPATIGSISTGTLRTQDLLRTFADELERICDTMRTDADRNLLADAREYARRLDSPADDNDTRAVILDCAADTLSELTDRLDALSPKGYHFSAHPGDGADFGWWPNDDD